MRSEAQKKADMKYAQKNKGKYTYWGTSFPKYEAERIAETLKIKGMRKAEFIRWGIKLLEEK